VRPTKNAWQRFSRTAKVSFPRSALATYIFPTDLINFITMCMHMINNIMTLDNFWENILILLHIYVCMSYTLVRRWHACAMIVQFLVLHIESGLQDLSVEQQAKCATWRSYHCAVRPCQIHPTFRHI
jgi:hypothetical protein